MKAILDNPYRIAGLLVGATTKEQEMRIKRLIQNIDVEHNSLQDDYSFPALGKLTRTIDSIMGAASKLILDCENMNASLFWFWNGDPITDEVAFSALKYGNKKDAMDIWTKFTYEKKVTDSNVSAFQNLSTLLLSMNDFEHGIKLKMKLLESNFITEFITAVADKTSKITKKELQSTFLNVLRNELDLNILNEILSDIEFSDKHYFTSINSQKIIDNIISNIEMIKKSRIANKEYATESGNDFYSKIKSDLEQLKSIHGSYDSIYSDIADKVANEILNYAIDYFNFWNIVMFDMKDCELTCDLINLADRIAVGSDVKNRIDKNNKEIDKYIEAHKSNKLNPAENNTSKGMEIKNNK